MIEDRRWDFVFVLEQALGHVVHAMNIERVLSEQDDIDVDDHPGRARRVVRHAIASVVPQLVAAEQPVTVRQALNRHIAANSPDAVFVHTQVAALLARDIMRKYPTIVSLDATPINFDIVGDAYGHSRQADVVEAGKKAVTRRALLRADAVVTWSRWAGASVVRDYGIDVGPRAPIAPGVDLRRLRPIGGVRDEGPVRFLFVGGDFERKGGLDLLEAMKILDRPAELDIVSSSAEAPAGLPGSRPLRRRRQLVRSSPTCSVEPTCSCCRRRVIAHRSPSPRRSRAACRCVATPVGSMDELVLDGENGHLVPPSDPRRLAGSDARV